jgi:hypothetical protein
MGADESRTKLVSRMFLKLGDTSVKYTMRQSVGMSLLLLIKKSDGKTCSRCGVTKASLGVGAHPSPWPNKGASKALDGRGLSKVNAILLRLTASEIILRISR